MTRGAQMKKQNLTKQLVSADQCTTLYIKKAFYTVGFPAHAEKHTLDVKMF